MPAPIDFVGPQVQTLMKALALALNRSNYPLTKSGAAVLVAMGVSHLRDLQIPESEITALLQSLRRGP